MFTPTRWWLHRRIERISPADDSYNQNPKLAGMQGFTLIELLVTLTVVSIMVSISVPRFQAFMEQQKLARATQEIRDYLQLGRNYAQTHQTQVRVCPIALAALNTPLPSCVNDNTWDAWMVAEVDDRGATQMVLACYLRKCTPNSQTWCKRSHRARST